MKNGYFYFYDAEDAAPVSVRKWLTETHGYSARLLTRIKNEGSILINDKECWFSDALHPGDHIRIALPDEAIDMTPVYRDIDVLYEDEEVLVINKDAGTVTHPTKRHQEDTLGNFVAAYLERKGESNKIRFVNRLDMDTTGVVVIAKNKYVHHYIQSEFAGPSEKSYMAFVHGIPEQPSGIITAPIMRVCPEDIFRKVDPAGKPCVTRYQVVETYQNAALIRLKLETGRTHQLRVHLQHIGHPIIGDPMYGAETGDDFGMTRQALHATDLILRLPTRGRMHFRAPFKADMMALWQKLSSEIDSGDL